MINPYQNTENLCAWLREHSSGNYKACSYAATLIENLIRQNKELKASIDGANTQEPVAFINKCDHDYHYFGTEQKRRRCNNCLQVEPDNKTE